ncbi:MAG TPA: aspartate kinase [Clostridia bacterium]|nr:aspartate kinase [Clostridia bacterium]
MKVVKFGGSSLADANQIRKVCDIVLSDRERRIVVVSAPGKRFDSDIKVTDMLIELASKKLNNEDYAETLENIVDRYRQIAIGLGLGEDAVEFVKQDLTDRLNSNVDSDAKFIDLMKAAGEDNTAKLVAKYFNFIGEKAVYMNPKDAGMLLSNDYGNARVLKKTYDNLAKLRDMEELVIFPGFFGYSEDGEVVTFSRGGSDVTGSVIAAAVNATVYENFTDVDYVFCANPKVIKDPKPISYFTYEEMRELSYAGFNVLHEETLEPVYRKKIAVNIRNTNNPQSPGTMIVPAERAERVSGENPVVGIAADKGFITVHVEKYMMNREIGFGRRLLTIFEKEGVSYEHAPSGIDSISVIVKERNCPKDKLERITDAIRKELEVDDVVVEHGLAIIMLVGRGMSRTVGIASRATSAIARANVNIRMINQGSSEVSIMFGVHEDDVEKSLIALYDEFFR